MSNPVEKSRDALVAEFREIMSDIMGGIPSSAHCRAVIEHKAAQLPQGPELWAVWYVEGDTATLCEFDGSVCYESYVNPTVAWRSAQSSNALYGAGKYVVALMPCGVAGMEGNKQVRAAGPVLPWRGGMDGGWTTCTVDLCELSPLTEAPAPIGRRKPLSPRKAYRAAQIAREQLASKFGDFARLNPLDYSPITRARIFETSPDGCTLLCDIIEADMTSSQFQSHFMRRGCHWTFAKTERDTIRSYELQTGYYVDGEPFWPYSVNRLTRSRV